MQLSVHNNNFEYKFFFMVAVASQLNLIIDEYLQQLNKIDEEKISFKYSPIKWSRKEELGHLVDSAQNNIRRFIVAQYEEIPTIIYNQEKWVVLNDYQQQPSQNIIKLWYLLNKQVVGILNNISEESAQRQSQSQELHTIEWLGKDYIKHLQHHMHHILELEPVPYP